MPVHKIGPRSIYVDILFADERACDSIRGLSQAICDISKDGIPVYLASASPFKQGKGVRDDLQKCATILTAQMPQEMADGVLRTYDLTNVSSGKTVNSPALALYYDYKKAEGTPALRVGDFEEQMQLYWGRQTAPLNNKWMNCNSPSLFSVLFGDFKESRANCPYTPTLSVRHLLGEGKSNDEDIQKSLEGKLVIYGASITGAGDIIRSPTHYELPGLYGHAMALDNLLTFNEGYKRDVNSLWADVLVQFGLLCIYAWLWLSRSGCELSAWVEERYSKAHGSGLPRIVMNRVAVICPFEWKSAKVMLRLLTIPALVFAYVFAAFFWLDYAPQNWVKFLIFSISLSGLKEWIEQIESFSDLLSDALKWIGIKITN